MKFKDIIKKIGIISAIAVGVLMVIDVILILRDYIEKKFVLRNKAEEKLNKPKTEKEEGIEILISEKMDYFEKILEKNGAIKREEFNELNREEFEALFV